MKKYIDVFVEKALKAIKEASPIKNYQYLLHHLIIDDKGNEEIHNCLVYDHMGNMFEQKPLIITEGKVFIGGKEIKNGSFSVIVGLEPTQDICWSDEEAIQNKITLKKMVAGMTYKQKAKEW